MRKKRSGKAYGMPAGIGIGILSAVGIMLLGVAAVTALIAGERLELDAFGFGVMVVLFLSGLIGAAAATAVVKRRRMQVSFLTGVGFFLVLLGMNALFFGGQYQGMLTTAGLIIAGCGIAAVVSSREAMAKNRRRRKPAYR